MQATIKLRYDDNSCYLYISGKDKDYLLTENPIVDREKRQAVIDLIGSIELRLYAHKRYKQAMNEAIAITRSGGTCKDVQTILSNALSQFGEEVFPGDLDNP